MAPKGRKSKYETHVQPNLEKIKTYCRKGLIEADICKKLGISTTSFNEYKLKHTDLTDALKEGKKVSDDIVESSLYKRAIGYKFTEVTRERVETLEFIPAVIVDGEIIEESRTEHSYAMQITKKVMKHQPADVTAIIFWLKYRRKDDWRDRKHLDITKSDPYDDMTPEELDEAYDEISGKIDAYESQKGSDTPE